MKIKEGYNLSLDRILFNHFSLIHFIDIMSRISSDFYRIGILSLLA